MTFEQLRLVDYVKNISKDVDAVLSDKNVSVLSGASKKLQDLYNFYVTAGDDFKEAEEPLRNLFSSFNYAALIINDALKGGRLDGEANELLGQCLQIMSASCKMIVGAFEGENN